MTLQDFDFPLPESLIAFYPAPKRDESRLFVLKRDGSIEHRSFADIIEYLKPGDMLLLNKTKVIPARITAVKPTGGKLDILLVKEREPGLWDILSVGKYTGSVDIGEISASVEDGKTLLISSASRESLLSYGSMPIPPYIKRDPDASDMVRYQTVYAEVEGSIAAPTAGLHFTEDLMKEIRHNGVFIDFLTLHVGRGTFKPVRADVVKEHKMDAEYFEIEKSLIGRIDTVRNNGGRLITVGTTATRAIESVYSAMYESAGDDGGTIRGMTEIFIYPGYEFKAVDGLLTNFHLPKSTPLMLASALVGRERLLEAYKIAIGLNYRFFSYGDAMLIV